MLVDSFRAETLRISLENILKRLHLKAGPKFGLNSAILDSKGDLVAVGGSNPLHYASFEIVAQGIRKYISPKQGEVLLTNDPYSGNTRLCDLTFLQGVYGSQTANELRYLILLQVTIPQLLSTEWKQELFTSVEEEGYRIPPTPLDQNGSVNKELVQYLARSGIASDELLSIFGQVKTALKNAVQETADLESTLGKENIVKGISDLRKYSETTMRAALHEIPDGEYNSHEFIDSDGFSASPVRIQCRLMVQGENVLLSFNGTSKQVKGPFNCTYAMTLAACFTVFRCLTKFDIPINSGAFRAFSVEAPSGTVVNASYPSPLLGGYFETSYRVCDVLTLVLSKALPLEIPSQNCGSSAPLLLRFKNKILLETIGGGTGGGQLWEKGTDAVKPYFDNSPGLSIEALECDFPLQILQSNVRDSSEGNGRSLGGRGTTKGFKVLADADLVLLGDRRQYKPQGLFGGTAGLGSEVLIIKSDEKRKATSEKAIVRLVPGDIVFLNTPGGGGWGKPEPEA